MGPGGALGQLRTGYAADDVLVRGLQWLDLADLTADNIVAIIARGQIVRGAVPEDRLS